MLYKVSYAFLVSELSRIVKIKWLFLKNEIYK